MLYRVSHVTHYRYQQPVTLGHNQLRLTPRMLSYQRCLSSVTEVSPEPSSVEQWNDCFGNQVSYFTLESPHDELIVTAKSLVEVTAVERSAAEIIETGPNITWEATRDLLRDESQPVDLTVMPFISDSPHVRRSTEPREYAAASFAPGMPLIPAVLDLTTRIFRDFRYDPSATSISTPTAEVFRRRRGVCQDFAHLELACLRSLGLAARYISGYLVTEPPAGQPKLIGADASHAWLSVFVPGYGWLDVDPTNNVVPSLRHVTLAWGRDYSDVCPVKGVVLGGGTHRMSVAVDVTQVAEDATAEMADI